MSRSTYPLKLPTSIKNEAARLAKQDGVSLNQWISAAVAQKVGSEEATREFFRVRAARAIPGEFERIMAKVPSNPPDPGDELPEGWERPASWGTPPLAER